MLGERLAGPINSVSTIARDQIRLVEMAAHAVDDRDQRSALIGGCEQAIECMEEWRRGEMAKRLSARSAVKYSGLRKNMIWIKPTLVAEIEYRAWTHRREATECLI